MTLHHLKSTSYPWKVCPPPLKASTCYEKVLSVPSLLLLRFYSDINFYLSHLSSNLNSDTSELLPLIIFCLRIRHWVSDSAEDQYSCARVSQVGVSLVANYARKTLTLLIHFGIESIYSLLPLMVPHLLAWLKKVYFLGDLKTNSFLFVTLSMDTPGKGLLLS